jgi:hypothetical protein
MDSPERGIKRFFKKRNEQLEKNLNGENEEDKPEAT